MQVGSLVVTEVDFAPIVSFYISHGYKISGVPVKDTPYTVSGFFKENGEMGLTLVEFEVITFSGERGGFYIEDWKEIQPPMEVSIEQFIQEPIEA